ncbi:26212_t:CDS:2, partial [Racocetra persica]
LLALMNNNPDIFNNARDQTSYLEIPKDELLFLPAERPIHPKPIVNILILRKKSTGMKTTDLIDLEEGESTKDPDVEIEEVHEDHEGPVASLISAQEEDNRSISDLFDYYYEKRSCSNIKYNIGEIEDDQRKQLLELLKENSDLCAQDISELGQTDIIRHCIPTQD